MPVINRDQVAEPKLAKEAVPLAPLDGDVIVRELPLTDRLAIEAAANAEGVSMHSMIPQLLAVAIVDEQDRPLFDVAQWNVFGGKHRDATIGLFNKAMQLSGFGREDTAKN